MYMGVHKDSQYVVLFFKKQNKTKLNVCVESKLDV